MKLTFIETISSKHFMKLTFMKDIINFAYQRKFETFYVYQVRTAYCTDTVSKWSVIIMSDYKPDIHQELWLVSRAGKCDRVRELLEAGADPDKYKDGDGNVTALHVAAYNGHNEVVKKLIQAKCDLHVKDVEGYTGIVRFRAAQMTPFLIIVRVLVKVNIL